MEIALQLLINGLIAGSIYALIASGFSLIYGTNRFMHLAHGGVVAASAYILFALSTGKQLNQSFAIVGADLPSWLSIPITLALGALIGVGVYFLIYRPLKKRNAGSATLLIASIAVLLLFENILLLLFGSDVKVIETAGIFDTSLALGGASFTALHVIVLAVTLSVFAGLWYFTSHSKLGRTMRAVADNPQLAEISGINAERVALQSFIIGSALGALAAVLYVPLFNAKTVMGTLLIVKGFAAAIIGGITSLPGAILGGYLVGVVENAGIWFLPSGFKDAIVFVLLFGFLLLRPAGILGIRKGVRQ